MTQNSFDFIVVGAGSSGCAVSAGDTAPVSPRLKLKGIEGLWVADADVMPSVTSANTNAPSIMIGYRAAQFIAQDHRLLASNHTNYY